MATDPLEALRQPVVPIPPREAFAVELRGRLVEALGLPETGRDQPATADATDATAAGQPVVSVYLCAHDAAAAIDFYRVAVEAVETPAERQPPASRPDGELGYFTLVAADVERAAAFYGALFGWRFDPPGPGDGGHTYSHVGNTSLPFGFHSDLGDHSPHHYYRVEDLATMVARVRELGGEVLDVTDYASGGNARCRDDQGIEFDLWQPAPGY